MENIIKELRFDSVSTNSESRIIEGRAIVFNSFSENIGFYEIILPTAISQELIDNSDVIANCEHDSQNYMMARSRNGKGTLQLELKADGLYFRFEAPTTPKGDELLYHVKNGNISECSFAFSISDEPDSERWYKNNEGQLCREIRKIGGLYDISLVAHPCYADTYCIARNKEKVKEIENILKDHDKLIDEILSL